MHNTILLCACWATLMLGGCATTAATELIAGAKQYEARSIEAINAVDLATKLEVAPPDISESVAEARWVTSLRASKLPTSENLIEFAYSGIKPTPGAEIDDRNRAFAALRAHHASFTAVFDNVERAGFLGKSPIGRCAPPIIEKLVARQVYLARAFGGDGAVQLLARRAALNAEIDRARTGPGTDAERNMHLTQLFQARKQLIKDEDALNAATISALTAAAESGLLLHKQAKNYRKISLADIESTASGLIAFAASSGGRDLTGLTKHAEGVFERIKADPDLQGAADILLNRVQDDAKPDEEERCMRRTKGRGNGKATGRNAG
jgi:hypothetical protein